MQSSPRLVAGLLLALTSCFAGVPTAAADPFPPVTGGQSASSTIDDLEGQGYDVRINWLTGFDTKPLTQCRVTGIHNPGNLAPSKDTFTTVYVDVVCPNGDDGAFDFGVGIG
jgi:hypothetical protein